MEETKHYEVKAGSPEAMAAAKEISGHQGKISISIGHGCSNGGGGNNVSITVGNRELKKKKKEDIIRDEEMLQEEDCTDHLYPMVVDTSDVAGEIIQVIFTWILVEHKPPFSN